MFTTPSPPAPPEWKPSAAPIVSMIEFKGRVLVATTAGVYELVDNKLVRLAFVEATRVSEAHIDLRTGKLTSTDGSWMK